MKSAPFEYSKPKSVHQAIALLQQYGDDARILAGGQTLIATLNMRLSDPQLVIDITGLDELRGITLIGDFVRIGALATHTEIEYDDLIRTHAPLLSTAAPYIAHRAIRNRGTWGGSIAYADPAAEWPTCLLALNGSVRLLGPNGERTVAIDDFFTGLYTTAIEADEILISSDIPIAQSTHWYAFEELARRHGDYAIVGMAASANKEGDRLSQPRIVLLGVDTTPVRAIKTEAVLDGKPITEEVIAQAEECLRAEIDPLPDLTNTPDTKRHLAAVLLKRILSSVQSKKENDRE
jgi:carbon-monoxide dehydrogenase medium subunit